MSIPFFSPIYPPTSACTNEKLSFLRSTTTFFDFGQKSYQVETIQGDLLPNLVPIDTKPTWMSIALRIVAIMTLIIPLFVLMGIALYRLANSFQVLNRFSVLPEDIQKLICKKAMLDGPSLASTNKQINAFMQNDLDLIKNRIIALIIEQSFEEANAQYDDLRGYAFCEIAEFVLPLDKKKGLAVLDSALAKARSINAYQLGEIARILAPYDLKNAEKIVKEEMRDGDDNNSLVLARIATAIAKQDYEKALKIINTIEMDGSVKVGVRSQIYEALAVIAIAMAKDDMGRAMQIVDSVDAHKDAKFIGLLGIAEILILSNYEGGMELANQAATIANSLNNGRDQAILKLISFFSTHNREERAIELALSMDDDFSAEALAKLDLDKALLRAEAIQDKSKQSLVLCEISKKISTTHPEKAFELVQQALYLARSLDYITQGSALSAAAGAMAIFDREKAIAIAESIFKKEDRISAFTGILKAITPKNYEEAAKVVRLILKEVKSIERPWCHTMYEYDEKSAQRLKMVLNIGKAFSEN